ncbi:MAG: hypothetical protein FWE91_13395 [Defluviitaleaceae bacterium]|nr:hypothetical protein [Defluviitaleaceae bacterium]
MRIRAVTSADIPKWKALSEEYDCYILELVPDLTQWYGGNDNSPPYDVYMAAKIEKGEAFIAVDRDDKCLVSCVG